MENHAMLDEFDYFKAHQDEIVTGHIGEIAIIKDHAVKGYYKTMDDALEASRNYPIETFLLKDCRPKGTDVVRLYNRMIRFANAEEQ
ncbi:MAG: hypothetical protein MdMp014T_1653 [Treponematales bacterium]